MSGISFGAELPVPPDRAFAVVSDPTMWPRFFDPMRSAHVTPGWGRPGCTAGLVIRFMGRGVSSALEILEWDPPRSIRYVARQAGRPDLDNLRVIEPAEGGSRLVGTIRMTPRRGLLGVVDRISLQVLQRVFDAAMAKLPAVALDSSHRTSDPWREIG